jgi:hypothetical protein
MSRWGQWVLMQPPKPVYLLPPCVAISVGALTGAGFGLLVSLALLSALWLVILLVNWRLAPFGLLLFLPFAAVPGLILQQSGWPTLLKDVVFVIPAYLLALLAARRDGLVWELPTTVSVGLIGLIVLIGAQTIESVRSSPLVALVGLKTWLLYLPLILLAQQLFANGKDAMRWVRVLVAVALIPCAVGIVEAVLIYSGAADIVYGFYGSLASKVTQDFAVVGIGNDLGLRRIPSTFTFVAQYDLFLFAMVPLAASVWLGDSSKRWRVFGGIALLIISVAGVTSGARAFLVWLPIQLGLILILTGPRGWIRFAALSSGLGIGFLFVGGIVAGVPQFLAALANDYLFGLPFREIQAAVSSVGWLGAGVGTQTGASRYLLEPGSVVGVGIEGWYGKTLFELGLPGLVVVLYIWIVCLRRLWLARRVLKAGPYGVLASAIFVFALSTMVNLVKGPVIDIDPLNVYFWFFVGLGLALQRLGTRDAAAMSQRDSGVTEEIHSHNRLIVAQR